MAALEGLGFLVYGIALVPSIDADKVAVGVTSAVFMIAYGVFVVFCAREVLRLRSWSRAPLVMVQLLDLLVGLTWGAVTWVPVVLVVTALVVLGGLFHPASLAALADRGEV
jgi:hypothetical protein